MSAPVVDVADAIVVVLNAASMSQSFTAVRKHTHLVERVGLDLQVLVVPKSDETRVGSRGQIQRTLSVDIAILAETTTEAENLAMSDFVEEIKDELLRTQMASAEWFMHDNDPLYTVEDIDGLGQFTSVVTEFYLLYENE